MIFYETPDDKPVVEEEIRNFGLKPQARIIQMLFLVEQFGIELQGDYLKHVSGKIWELRVSRFRILYFTFTARKFIVLRAFIKKTNKTPKKEIKIAESRMEEYLRHTS